MVDEHMDSLLEDSDEESRHSIELNRREVGTVEKSETAEQEVINNVKLSLELFEGASMSGEKREKGTAN